MESASKDGSVSQSPPFYGTGGQQLSPFDNSRDALNPRIAASGDSGAEGRRRRVCSCGHEQASHSMMDGSCDFSKISHNYECKCAGYDGFGKNSHILREYPRNQWVPTPEQLSRAIFTVEQMADMTVTDRRLVIDHACSFEMREWLDVALTMLCDMPVIEGRQCPNGCMEPMEQQWVCERCGRRECGGLPYGRAPAYTSTVQREAELERAIRQLIDAVVVPHDVNLTDWCAVCHEEEGHQHDCPVRIAAAVLDGRQHPAFESTGHPVESGPTVAPSEPCYCASNHPSGWNDECPRHGVLESGQQNDAAQPDEELVNRFEYACFDKGAAPTRFATVRAELLARLAGGQQ